MLTVPATCWLQSDHPLKVLVGTTLISLKTTQQINSISSQIILTCFLSGNTCLHTGQWGQSWWRVFFDFDVIPCFKRVKNSIWCQKVLSKRLNSIQKAIWRCQQINARTPAPTSDCRSVLCWQQLYKDFHVCVLYLLSAEFPKEWPKQHPALWVKTKSDQVLHVLFFIIFLLSSSNAA